jgi:hypothetical protein
VVAAALLAAVALAVAVAFLVLPDRDEGVSAGATTSATSGSSSAAGTGAGASTGTGTGTGTGTRTAAEPGTPTGAAGRTTAEVCDSARLGLRITYPAGWYTPPDGDFSCALFDPDPFEVTAQSEVPFVAVIVTRGEGSLGDQVARIRGSAGEEVVRGGARTLGGRDGYCLTTRSNGEGLIDAGASISYCLVDFGSFTATFQNVRLPDVPDRGFAAVVESVAAQAQPAG